jgi:hypothetical protein
MLCTRYSAARRGFASTSTLTIATCPSSAATASSRTGVSWRQGPHHSAQKSTITGTSWERSITSRAKL